MVEASDATEVSSVVETGNAVKAGDMVEAGNVVKVFWWWTLLAANQLLRLNLNFVQQDT